MKMKTYFILAFCLALSALSLKAQNKSSDNCMNADTWWQMGEYHRNNQSDSAEYYYSLILNNYNKLENYDVECLKIVSSSYRRIGAIYLNYGEYELAARYFDSAF
jgi:tetratricopeptide (TPR) repeat protein